MHTRACFTASFCFLTGVAALVVLLILFGPSMSAYKGDYPNTRVRYNVAFNSSESWEGYMAQYGAVLEELQVSGESLVYESQLDKQWTACRKSHRWLTLMEDPKCLLQLMLRLSVADESYAEVQDIKPVQHDHSQKGGIRLRYPDGLRAYWKPCTRAQGWGTENSESEIIAFHLDKLLAFHRVLPVVGKRLRLSELRVPPMSEPTGTSLRTIQKYCAESDGFTWGSLVAWAPFRVRSRIKYRNESKDSEDGKELSRLLLFIGLTGATWRYKSGGHNLIRMFNHSRVGPIIYLDNDRTEYSEPYGDERDAEKSFYKDVCSRCHYPRDVYTRINSLNETHPLSARLKTALSYEQRPVSFTPKMQQVLDDRVLRILECMASCSSRYTLDEMLY